MIMRMGGGEAQQLKRLSKKSVKFFFHLSDPAIFWSGNFDNLSSTKY